MNVLIDRSEIAGTIPAPPSKSYTHRAIAIASLSVESEIAYPLLSADTKATIAAARAIGADVTISDNR
jgi:3-phosphoshikimate 1-carboxyvinyltransferase